MKSLCPGIETSSEYFSNILDWPAKSPAMTNFHSVDIHAQARTVSNHAQRVGWCLCSMFSQFNTVFMKSSFWKVLLLTPGFKLVICLLKLHQPSLHKASSAVWLPNGHSEKTYTNMSPRWTISWRVPWDHLSGDEIWPNTTAAFQPDFELTHTLSH